MTAGKIKEQLNLIPLFEGDPEKEVTGGYCGDLLSWVMGRCEKGDCWITIMSNRNVAAVAQLTEAAMVLFAEGVDPDESVLEAARANGLNLYKSPADAFTLCARVAQLLT